MAAHSDTSAARALEAFHQAAARVPAYAQLLAERGITPGQVRTAHDFRRLVPVLDKQSTFGRFSLPELCLDGQLGPLAGVLTSSGHGGRFSFGLYAAESAGTEVDRLDAALDQLFQVRTRPTLLVNCLPMGVRVATRWCTLAETSVRADMVTAIVSRLGEHYEQILLVGETAFLKHVLELGVRQGIDWTALRVQAIVGEEPLAENARRYLERLLGIDPDRPETGLVGSSMGVAEVGLNLFFELPPLISLRRALHVDPALREALLGAPGPYAPCVFTYDPSRLLVETDHANRLVLTALDLDRRIPMIRYATGDVARTLTDPRSQASVARALGPGAQALSQVPIVLVFGRGQFALAGTTPVYPEQIKEGLYHDADLAAMTTANFRLHSGPERAAVRVQLSPGVEPEPSLRRRFAAAIAPYAAASLEVACEAYDQFGSGMSLDYERKFDYLGS